MVRRYITCREDEACGAWTLWLSGWIRLQMGTVQLAHAADESILCREPWRRGLFSSYFESSCYFQGIGNKGCGRFADTCA